MHKSFLCDASNCESIQPAGANAITVTIPNGEQIRSTHTATLKWPHLPPSARTCHIFPTLKNKILLSIGQFCDAGLNSAFTISHLYIYDRSTIFLQGKRKPGNGMWYIYLQSKTPISMYPIIQQYILGTIPEINNVYKIGKKEDIIMFLSQDMIQVWGTGFHISWERNMIMSSFLPIL